MGSARPARGKNRGNGLFARGFRGRHPLYARPSAFATHDSQRVLQEAPQYLRYVVFYDEKTDKRLGFFTNNFELPALLIAQLYKCRWQVELFFKWIKQHLRIKAFFGTNENAVKTQIWIAISVYVLVAIVKKRLGVDASLYTILQILSLALFEKAPLHQLLSDRALQTLDDENSNQLNLFR